MTTLSSKYRRSSVRRLSRLRLAHGRRARRSRAKPGGVRAGQRRRHRDGCWRGRERRPGRRGQPGRFVDPMVGTGSGGATVGQVDTFPGADMPFGMIQWSPDTPSRPDGGGYNYDDSPLPASAWRTCPARDARSPVTSPSCR